MSEFCSALTLARHVSGLTGASSGKFLTSCIRRFGMCYYCAYYLYYHIPKSANTVCAKNAPDGGPMRSETCKANT